jgi:hypothetical protein
MSEEESPQVVNQANQGTPTASELRAKVILGDNDVKNEVNALNSIIRKAGDTGQTRIVVASGTTMAGVYEYGSWWCIEEVFQQGAIGKKVEGDNKGSEVRNDEGKKHFNGFTSVTRLGGAAALEGIIMPDLLKLIKNVLGPNALKHHSQINAVLAHYRKLGYQIHPGNWFDATVTQPIKWVINWNNTIMDHIMMIDNTLVIGKPTNFVPLGSAERDGTLDAAGTPNPVPNYVQPTLPQTSLEFLGLGNKGFGKIKVTPADGKMGGTNNVGWNLHNQAEAGGDFDSSSGGSSAAGISSQTALIGSLAANLGIVIGELTQTGLFTSEVGSLGGSNYNLHSGIRNTLGNGVTPELANIDLFEANGAPYASGYSPPSQETPPDYGGGSEGGEGGEGGDL